MEGALGVPAVLADADGSSLSPVGQRWFGRCACDSAECPARRERSCVGKRSPAPGAAGCSGLTCACLAPDVGSAASLRSPGLSLSFRARSEHRVGNPLFSHKFLFADSSDSDMR